MPRTLKAYSIYLKKSEKKRPLLIADLKEDKLDIILKEQGIEEIKPYLSYPGYIPNKDLAYLYNGAYAFLYTSLRERFGIPMLEAMACGCECLVSDIDTAKNVVGEYGYTFKKSDVNDLKNKLCEILGKPKADKAEQIEYVKNNYSWDEITD